MATSKTSALLQGKKVVVIGGSSGIGFSAASAFIEEGATVIIGSSSQSRVDSAIQRLSDPNIQYNADPSRISGHTVNLKALDLSDKGIRVNAVAPGAVETELWHAFPEETRKQVLQSRGDKLLTGRVGQPEDLANVYIYLTKDKNITAQIIVSDGGDSTVERS
ncbi:probable conserved hypothetcial protein [Melanopsichium pennsylvanicum]|uniref:Probable conserved hypothetcial protein n=1 Tax=Melanopsichium pennsylvanicum TaxID=63383 RepID=A0AAJ5C8J1_9BASI|nr:probable conserved hypothetcial protein [Melanopsichium pennsylvanicum]